MLKSIQVASITNKADQTEPDRTNKNTYVKQKNKTLALFMQTKTSKQRDYGKKNSNKKNQEQQSWV